MHEATAIEAGADILSLPDLRG